jgi:hypothetical protein
MARFYSQTMTNKQEQIPPPAFTLAMFLRSLLFGGIFGLTLLFLGAPLWVFYVGQVSMAPWILWELLHLEAKEKREQATKAPGRTQSRRKSRSVA